MMMMGSNDKVESERQAKAEKRSLKEKERYEEPKKKYLEDIDLMLDTKDSEGINVSLEENVCTMDQPYGNESVEKEKRKYNTIPITNTAKASLRYQNSAGQTAVVCSAFLKDLIEAGVVPKDMSYLALDQSKVMRAQAKVLSDAAELGNLQANEDVLSGLFSDGRKDLTKILIYDEHSATYRQGVVKEEHISVTSEPDGSYRLHFTP